MSTGWGIKANGNLTYKVLVATIDAQWEGMARYKVRASTTSPMPDHKGFKLQ